MYDSATGMSFKPEGEPDKAIPEFFMEAAPNPFQSEKEGRPVFDDVEKVRILIPGQRLQEAVERVKDHHRLRWPAQYAAFKAGTEAPVDGMPIEEWPPLTPALAKNLRHMEIRTVEILAGLSDAQLPSLGMGGRELREKAKTWLANASDGKPLAEALAKNTELQAKLDVQGQTIEAMQAAIEKLQTQGAAS